MVLTIKTSRTTTFDGWVLRADVGELAKGDRKIRLQQRPLLVLEELLANPGELVTREQLIARLWPKGVVDFDTGLNTAVRKLRVALDDVGEVPRYIETLPRKGYRFIGTIDPPEAADPQPATPQPSALAAPKRPPPQTEDVPPASAPVAATRSGLRYAVAALLMVAAGGLILFIARTPRDPESSSPGPPPTVSKPARRDDLAIALLPLKGASNSEPDETLAKIVSDLLLHRLGKLDSAEVIDTTAMPRSRIDAQGLQGFAATMHARYLLDGKVEKKQDQLHVVLALVDASSGARLWSLDQDRDVNDLPNLVDEVVRDVADHMHVRADALAASPASSHINLDAYGLYVRAQEFMDNQSVADTQTALEQFRRATVLDPKFALGYLGLSQALVLSGGLSDGKTKAEVDKLEAEARAASDHALELDPTLGEVLIERARFTDDSTEAEKLYREGLRLAPNYGAGYQRYAEFLFDEYRRGEAIEAIDHARAIGPLKPRLILRQALFHLFLDSDAEAHDRLVHEALAINPKLVLAVSQLGISRFLYSGEFADAIRLLEQSIQLDPFSDELKMDAALMYLDVDDPDAALALLKLCSGTPVVLASVAQYQRDRRRAAQLARAVPLDQWDAEFEAPEAGAMRDEAIATGDFKLALELMSKRFALVAPWGPKKTSGPRLWNRALGLVYAHTLVSAGQVQQGRQLAQAILAQLDGESVGRVQFYLSRNRAAAFVILGDKERALTELKNSLSIGHYYYWWYLGELDPLYQGLRPDPRFQALVAQAKQHRVRQRALVEELRRTGQIPRR